MADASERPALPDPEKRGALVGELAALIDRAATLTPAETAVLRHILAHAGFDLDGRLRIPAFAALWGGAGDSYFPAAALPAEQVRAAATVLQRRGVLRVAVADSHELSGVIVDADVLRALAG
jgi:hypothetical protein